MAMSFERGRDFESLRKDMYHTTICGKIHIFGTSDDTADLALLLAR